MDADEDYGPPSLWRRAVPKVALLAVIAFGGTAIAGGVFALMSTTKAQPVEVATVAEVVRQGVVWAPSARAFIVSDGNGVLALYGRSTHLGERVYFCPSSGWFEDPSSGSKWDGVGDYTLGPAPRGLDRLPVRIDNGLVFVDKSRILRGPARGSVTTHPAKGPFCFAPGGYPSRPAPVVIGPSPYPAA